MSRGVTVLVAKSTPFELVSMVFDRQGRYLFMQAIVGGAPLLILAIYIPPLYRLEVVTEGLAYIAQFSSLPVVHRAYLTPLRMAKFQHTYNQTCHLCQTTPGTFHISSGTAQISRRTGHRLSASCMTRWGPPWCLTPRCVYWDFCRIPHDLPFWKHYL